eukprot:m.239113 g.239113  ORF g.239113 m.239113 type:complete len:426 (+) comp15292_c0_seq3:76-1353(+)
MDELSAPLLGGVQDGTYTVSEYSVTDLQDTAIALDTGLDESASHHSHEQCGHTHSHSHGHSHSDSHEHAHRDNPSVLSGHTNIQMSQAHSHNGSLSTTNQLLQALWFAFVNLRARKLVALFAVNAVCLVGGMIMNMYSESLVLWALLFRLAFDCCGLCILILSLWVLDQRPTQRYPFGYERFEVLGVFTGIVVLLYFYTYLIIECLEAITESTHSQHEPFYVAVVSVVLGLTSSFTVKTLWRRTHVFQSTGNDAMSFSGARSRERQQHTMTSIASHAIAVATSTFLHFEPTWKWLDTLAALAVCALQIKTLWPVLLFNARVLAHAVPFNMRSQLDKAMKEVATLDGVLEVQRYQFWAAGHSKIVGQLHVRTRQDYSHNHAAILQRLTAKLSPLVSPNLLTIQLSSSHVGASSARYVQSPYHGGYQ